MLSRDSPNVCCPGTISRRSGCHLTAGHQAEPASWPVALSRAGRERAEMPARSAIFVLVGPHLAALLGPVDGILILLRGISLGPLGVHVAHTGRAPCLLGSSNILPNRRIRTTLLVSVPSLTG